MRGARFFSLFTFTLLLGYGAMAYGFLPWAAFEGDLTRMAMLPERQFGWTREQPALQGEWMKQAGMQDADVLVIGDSFSTGRVWQTVLTRDGLRVRTEHWANLPVLCADLADWLRSKGFKGRHIVLQIVERNLARDVGKSMACAQTRYRSRHDVDADQPIPTRQFDPTADDRSGRMSVGLKTLWHAMRAEQLSRQPGFQSWAATDEVLVRRVPNGCELFSHRQCQDALFLVEDRAEDLPGALVNDMAALSARLPGALVTWVVVPNKTTAYLHPDKRFWDRAEAQLQSPNLLRIVRTALEAQQGTSKDLYLGNNTHFSTEGYLLMGRAIRDAMGRQR